MKKTYCFAILRNITRTDITDLKLVEANYALEGLTSVVEDQYNKQKYRITIIPIKEAAHED